MKITDEMFNESVKAGVEQAMKECELTIGMTLKEAVDKQIPQKVRYLNRHGEGYDHWNRDYYNCPACGRRLRNKQHDPYCPKCGQALDWGQEE